MFYTPEEEWGRQGTRVGIPKPERWVPVLRKGCKDIRPQQAWSWRELLIHIEFDYSFPGGLRGGASSPVRPASPDCWAVGKASASPVMPFAFGDFSHDLFMIPKSL